MPDPKDNVKKTGDTHLPDTESEFSVDQANAEAAGTGGTPGERGQTAGGGEQGRAAGRGRKKAGVPKDRDAKSGG